MPARMQAGDAGGIFQHAAALLGLGLDDFADAALVHQRRRARAGGGVREQDLHVARAHLAAVDAIGRARFALDAAGDFQEDRRSLTDDGAVRSRLSMVIATSAWLREGRLPEPAKITESMSAARSDLCEVSPITQRSASTRLDLPQPFGPTTPVSPGSIWKSVGSTKDLKPCRRSRVSFMEDWFFQRANGARFAAVMSRKSILNALSSHTLTSGADNGQTVVSPQPSFAAFPDI